MEFCWISIPSYLNDVHYYNGTLFTYSSVGGQRTNMTSVFLVLMTRLLVAQNLENIANNFYNDAGEGANKTKSSAKASMNKFKLAMVNSLHSAL